MKKIRLAGWRIRDSKLTPFLLFFTIFVIWWRTGSFRPAFMDFLWHAECDAKCLERALAWKAPELQRDLPKGVVYIHQTWKTKDIPPKFKKWSQSWRRCFPNAKFIFWTDDDNMNFIAKHYPWFLDRYLSFPSNIFRVDAVRYFYMLHYGGIYTDMDTECVRPFLHLLTAPVVLGAMAGHANVKEGYVQNSFMYSQRGHPLWLRIVKKLQHSWNRRMPEELTGPNALALAITTYRAERKDDITIYPPHYFNPFSWMTNKIKACKDYNTMTEQEALECRKAFTKTSYVIQYHAHTWQKPVFI